MAATAIWTMLIFTNKTRHGVRYASKLKKILHFTPFHLRIPNLSTPLYNLRDEIRKISNPFRVEFRRRCYIFISKSIFLHSKSTLGCWTVFTIPSMDIIELRKQLHIRSPVIQMCKSLNIYWHVIPCTFYLDRNVY